MLRLKSKQRELLADVLKDVANIAVGAMGFGHFLSERTFSLAVMLGGLGIWIGFVLMAVLFASGGRNE